MEEKANNEIVDRNGGGDTGKKGTKRNACDNPSNVKKQAKVIDLTTSPRADDPPQSKIASIHRSKVSDSSAHESASSDDSLLEDPFSLQYVLHVTYFSVVISCEKVHKSTSREEMEKKQTRTKSPSNFTAEIKLYLCFRTSLKL